MNLAVGYGLVLCTVVLGTVAIILNGVFLLRSARRHRELIYQALTAMLLKRGWKQSLAMPQRVVGAANEGPIMMNPPTSVGTLYTNLHVYERDSIQLYFGVLKEADRSRRKNTVIVATNVLRSTVPCLVATTWLAPSFFERQTVLVVQPSLWDGAGLCVHFCGKRDASEPEVVRTLDIVELVFNGAKEMFEGDVVAVLGPKGLIVRGPLASAAEQDIASVERFVRGAEHLLDCYKAVWDQQAQR